MTVKNHNEINQNIELVLSNNRPMASSLEIAERFGKRHGDVLRAIHHLQKNITDKNFYQSNFVMIEIQVKIGKLGNIRKSPAYLITRDGFCLLGFGFTGVKALAWKLRYIQAFNDMAAVLEEQNRQQPIPLPLLCFDLMEETEEDCRNRHLGIIKGLLSFWALQDGFSYRTAEKMLCAHLDICGIEEYSSDHFQMAWNFIIQHSCYIRNDGERLDDFSEFNLNKLFQACSSFKHMSDLDISEMVRGICGNSIENMPMANPQKLLNLAWGLFHYSYGFSLGREYTLQEVLAHANQ